MIYYFYKITNNLNGKFYYGVHAAKEGSQKRHGREILLEFLPKMYKRRRIMRTNKGQPFQQLDHTVLAGGLYFILLRHLGHCRLADAAGLPSRETTE
jgi:hypothetical protein